MTTKQRIISATLFATASALAFAAPGFAQPAQGPAAQHQPGAPRGQAMPQGPRQQAAPQQQQPQQQQQQAGQPQPGAAKPSASLGKQDDGAQYFKSPAAEGGQNQRSPIFVVTDIEVIESPRQPLLHIVRVTGLASTSGWSDPELTPLGAGTPSDGVLDLVLMANGPGDTVDADGFARVEALLPIEPDHPFKAIRVRSATNALSLRQIPGHAEARRPAEDCAKCVGKVFLAKGEPVPAGAMDVVKQEDLPGTLIIKPTDGVGDAPTSPNRLTLIIGEDGKIVDAFWN